LRPDTRWWLPLAGLLACTLSACASPWARADRALQAQRWEVFERRLQHPRLAPDDARLLHLQALAVRQDWPALVLELDRGGLPDPTPAWLVEADRVASADQARPDRWWLAWQQAADGDAALRHGEGMVALAALGDPASRRAPDAEPLAAALVHSVTAGQGLLSPDEEARLGQLLDQIAWRLLYLRRAPVAQRFVDHLEALGAYAFTVERLALAVALERGVPDAEARLLAWARHDPDLLSALAQDFRSRGAHRAAAATWQLAADHPDPLRAAHALRQVADAHYQEGRTDEARRILDEAFAQAGDPLTALIHLRLATGRGDGVWALDQARAWLEAPDVCADRRAEGVLELALEWSRSFLVPGQLQVDRVVNLYEHLATHCPADLVSRAAADLLYNAGQDLAAWPFMVRAQRGRPDDEEALRRLIRAAHQLDRVDDVLPAVERWLETLGAPPTDADIRRAMQMLALVPVASLAALRDTWAAGWLEGAAPPMELALVRAAELDQGRAQQARDALLQRAIDAAPDRIQALAQVVMWGAGRLRQPTDLLPWSIALARDPDAVGAPLPAPWRDARDPAEVGWLTSLDAAGLGGDSGLAWTCIEGFATQRGFEDPDTWRVVWSHRRALALLDADTRLRITEAALAAGFDGIDVLVAHADGLLRAGRTAEARAAWLRAVQAEPAVADPISRSLIESGHPGLAVSVLEEHRRSRPLDVVLAARLAGLTIDWARTATHPDLRLQRLLRGRALWEEVLAAPARGFHVELTRLDDPDLLDLALTVGLQQARQPDREDPGLALKIVDWMAARGAPWDEIAPWVERARPALEQQRGGLPHRLARQGYPLQAAELGLGLWQQQRRQGNFTVLSARRMADDIAATDDADRLARFAREELADPARAWAAGTPDPDRWPAQATEERTLAANLMLLASQVLADAGRIGEAAATARQGLEMRPDDPTGLLQATVDLHARAPDAALTDEAVARWVALTPGRAQEWALVGAGLQHRGQPALAARAFDRALRLGPTEARAMTEAIPSRAMPHDEALAAWETFVESAPEASADALVQLTAILQRALREGGEPTRADALLDAVADRFPQAREVPWLQARALRWTTPPDQLQTRLQRQRATTDDPLAWAELGLFEPALDTWARHGARWSGTRGWDIMMQLGLEWQRRRGADAWMERLQEVARGLTPPMRAFLLANTHALQGRHDESRALLQPLVPERERLPALVQNLLDTLQAPDTLPALSPLSWDRLDGLIDRALLQVGEAGVQQLAVQGLARGGPDARRWRLALAMLHDDLPALLGWLETVPLDADDEAAWDDLDRVVQHLLGAGLAAEAWLAWATDPTREAAAPLTTARLAAAGLPPDEAHAIVARIAHALPAIPEAARAWSQTLALHPDAPADWSPVEAAAQRLNRELALPLIQARAARTWLAPQTAAAWQGWITRRREGAVAWAPEHARLAWWTGQAAQPAPMGPRGWRQESWHERLMLQLEATAETDRPALVVRMQQDAPAPGLACADLDLRTLTDLDRGWLPALESCVDTLHSGVWAHRVRRVGLGLLRGEHGAVAQARALIAEVDHPQQRADVLQMLQVHDLQGRLAAEADALWADGGFVDDLSRLQVVELWQRAEALDQACARADQAWHASHDALLALDRLGPLMIECGHARDLLQRADTVRVTWPDSPLPAAWSALAHMADGHWERATADVQRLLAQGGMRVELLPVLLDGALRYGGGEHPLTWTLADALAPVHDTVSPDRGGIDGLARVLEGFRQRDGAAGLAWLQARHPALLRWPERSPWPMRIAGLWDAAGQPARAANVTERVLAYRPDDPQARNNHAWSLLTRMDRPAAAEALARQALALHVGLDRLDGAEAALDTLAMALHRQGRHAEAQVLVERALRRMAFRAPDAGQALAEMLEHRAAIRAALPEGPEPRARRNRRAPAR
jgi:tetratricopeptide (TPR) repeat protein